MMSAPTDRPMRKSVKPWWMEGTHLLDSRRERGGKTESDVERHPSPEPSGSEPRLKRETFELLQTWGGNLQRS